MPAMQLQGVFGGFFEGASLRYLTLGVSAALHAMLFIGFGGQPSATSDHQQIAVTRMSFLAPSPEPVQENRPEQKAEPKPVETKPEAKPKTEIKAVQEDVEKPNEPVSDKPPVKSQVANAAAASPAEAAQLNDGLIQQETAKYLTEVMAHIEQHKWYPKAARRRGIEGEVHVSFTLLPDGTAAEIQVGDAPSVLLSAAKKAVEKAVPMPSPPASIHCPLPCEFRMRFSLNAT